MAFKKGDKRPEGSGRKKGTTNKSTAKIRGFLTDIIAGQGDKLKDELDKLEGRDYVNAVSQLMKYAVPQMKAVDMNLQTDNSGMKIIIERADAGDKAKTE